MTAKENEREDDGRDLGFVNCRQGGVHGRLIGLGLMAEVCRGEKDKARCRTEKDTQLPSRSRWTTSDHLRQQLQCRHLDEVSGKEGPRRRQ